MNLLHYSWKQDYMILADESLLGVTLLVMRMKIKCGSKWNKESGIVDGQNWSNMMLKLEMLKLEMWVAVCFLMVCSNEMDFFEWKWWSDLRKEKFKLCVCPFLLSVALEWEMRKNRESSKTRPRPVRGEMKVDWKKRWGMEREKRCRWWNEAGLKLLLVFLGGWCVFASNVCYLCLEEVRMGAKGGKRMEGWREREDMEWEWKRGWSWRTRTRLEEVVRKKFAVNGIDLANPPFFSLTSSLPRNLSQPFLVPSMQLSTFLRIGSE